MAGVLYLVATPIGNLEDISLRAIRVLKAVAVIACEDTRQSAKLLTHLGIAKETLSYHEHNEDERAADILERLRSGADVALISDAGTPLISDPGYRLVSRAATEGVRVVPIPGASAPIAALAASGLASDEFRFCGFLPSKAGARKRMLEARAEDNCTLIFFESPHRIIETLKDIESVMRDRPVVIARELTKVHEEILRGGASEVRAVLESRDTVKGEITLLIGKAASAARAADRPADAAQLREQLTQLLQTGMSRMDAIKTISRQHGLPKRTVYKAVETD